MNVCGEDKSIAGARDAAIIAILTMCGLRKNKLAIKMAVSVNYEDDLQRFERVKIEATSITVSEPRERMFVGRKITK